MEEMSYEKIEELRSKVTPGELKLFKPMPPNPAFRRVDIYIGDTVPEDLKNFGMPRQRMGNQKQFAHFHPETPAVYDKNENWENDAEWILNSKKMVEFLLDEIKKLKGE